MKYSAALDFANAFPLVHSDDKLDVDLYYDSQDLRLGINSRTDEKLLI